jgi:predicted RNase H-like HicB family nuclease
MTKDYLVVFAKCAGSNFSGHAPDVPGCVSAGETLEEMQSMMREALEFHFQGLLEEREPIPEPRTQNVEFKPEDFEDVEYFVVQKLAVKVPAGAEKLKTHQAA